MALTDLTVASTPFLQMPSGTPAFEARFLTALAEALLPAEDAGIPVPTVAAFLSHQRHAMPHLFPRALGLASFAVDLATLPRHGRRFHRLSLKTRREVVFGWRTARIGALRNFLKYHAVFVAYLRHERIPVERRP